MTRPISEQDRERLRKVVGVMRSATIEGEKAAATKAAERIAESLGMSLAEAIDEVFDHVGRPSYDERQAQRQETMAWAASMVRMTEAYEQSEKYRYMMAKQEAMRRGLEEGGVKPERIAPKAARRYIPGKQDEFRLIAGLLREGCSLRRTAEVVGVSTNAVARVWLLIRDERAA
ncbi:MAG: hypothetical protein RIM72_21515 [Alphaproteobacteria bacterium]